MSVTAKSTTLLVKSWRPAPELSGVKLTVRPYGGLDTSLLHWVNSRPANDDPSPISDADAPAGCDAAMMRIGVSNAVAASILSPLNSLPRTTILPQSNRGSRPGWYRVKMNSKWTKAGCKVTPQSVTRVPQPSGEGPCRFEQTADATAAGGSACSEDPGQREQR